MNKTEIKKALYKQKPIGEFTHIKSGIAYYRAEIRINGLEADYDQPVFFEIPVDDMGNSEFSKAMSAQLLNRWIMVEEEV